jgi:nitrogen regulatory protein P-II 1
MKQIKAFVHRQRVGDLVHALESGGFAQLSLFEVKGLLRAWDTREQEYSVDLGESVISEVQMEVFCEDDQVDRALEIFQRLGRTGRAGAGWLYVSAVERAIRLD